MRSSALSSNFPMAGPGGGGAFPPRQSSPARWTPSSWPARGWNRGYPAGVLVEFLLDLGAGDRRVRVLGDGLFLRRRGGASTGNVLGSDSRLREKPPAPRGRRGLDRRGFRSGRRRRRRRRGLAPRRLVGHGEPRLVEGRALRCGGGEPFVFLGGRARRRRRRRGFAARLRTPPPPRRLRPARQPRPRPAPRRRRRLWRARPRAAARAGVPRRRRRPPPRLSASCPRGSSARRRALGGGGSLGVLESGGGSDGDGGFHAGDRGGGVHPRGDGLLRSLLLGLHQRRLLGGEPAKLLSLLRGNRAGAFLALLREKASRLAAWSAAALGSLISSISDAFCAANASYSASAAAASAWA